MHSQAEPWESPKPILLRRIRPERNERRFYALAVTADLFGNVVVMRHWGRIGTGGRQRVDRHHDFMSAMANLQRLAQRKRRRGYEEYDVFQGDLPEANPATPE